MQILKNSRCLLLFFFFEDNQWILRYSNSKNLIVSRQELELHYSLISGVKRFIYCYKNIRWTKANISCSIMSKRGTDFAHSFLMSTFLVSTQCAPFFVTVILYFISQTFNRQYYYGCYHHSSDGHLISWPTATFVITTGVILFWEYEKIPEDQIWWIRWLVDGTCCLLGLPFVTSDEATA